MSTTPVALPSGGAPVPVQVTGNPPAGHSLINSDPNATITITAGATGPAVAALLPGGSIVWTDPAVYPFASATGGAGTVLLVVTDQAANYSNPTVVAASTAVQTALQIAIQGAPPTYRQDLVFDSVLSANRSFSVPTYSTLLIQAQFSAIGAVRVSFQDDHTPQLDYPTVSYYLTQEGTVDSSACVWEIPCDGPLCVLTPITGTPPALVVVATNRPNQGMRQLDPAGQGVRRLHATATVAGTNNPMTPQVDAGPVSGAGYPITTRANGPVSLEWFLTGASAGTLLPSWIAPSGQRSTGRIDIAAGNGRVSWTHPSVPVRWVYFANAVNQVDLQVYGT